MCSDTSAILSIYVFTKEEVLFEVHKIETSALLRALEEDGTGDYFKTVAVKKKDFASLFPDLSVKSFFETFCQNFPLGLEVENSSKDLSVTDFYAILEMVDGEFASGQFLSDWDLSDDERIFKFCDFSGYGEMKKISCCRNNRYIICLDEKHTLLIFSSSTYFDLGVWGDGDIQDFVIYDTLDPDTLSVYDTKIGILRRYSNNYIYEIRKFPSFEFIYKIQLSEFAQLVDSKPNQDSWYVLEGNQILDAEEQSVLKIISLSETLPEARLMSLLNRRKFNEAEKYAKICNLNDEIIYKTKINCMLKDYSNNSSLNLTEQDVEYLWKKVEESLNKIKDIEFIKSCISQLVPEMEVMEKFLSSLCNWLVANNVQGTDDLFCEINNKKNKLITYNALPENIQRNLFLKDFLKKDVLQYLVSELVCGNLTTALILWQRHKNELLSSLNSDQVGEILNAVPCHIFSQHLIPFLREDFLPPVLSKLPEAVEIAADWIIPRISLMEITEKESWPENGDKLASMFIKLIEDLPKRAEKGGISYSTSISLSSIHKKLTSSEYKVGILYQLSKNLKLLLNLKEKFNCKISLTAFQDSKVDVIFAVLDRINLKFISQAVSEFAKPYALENNLDLDLNLVQFIKQSIQTSHFTWWSWDEAPWEERLTIVLECIHNTSHWVEAALYFISHAYVPWSNRVKNVAELGLNSQHPSKEKFKEQSKKASLKEVLVKYEIRDFPMNNPRHVDNLVNYILKVNKPSAMDDAKKVILSSYESLSTESYKKFLQFFLNQNKFDELLSLHSSVPSCTAIECAQSLLRFVTFCLEDDALMKIEDENHIICLLDAGIYFIEYLKSKKQPVPDLLSAFKSMKKLLKEFRITVTLGNVTDKKKALKIVENFISSFLDENGVAVQKKQKSEKDNKTIAFDIFKAKRLGFILNFDDANVMALLIMSCLQRKKYELVISLCLELVSSEPSSHCAKTLLQVLNHFFENFQNIKNLSFETIIDTVCHLSNVAVTYCDNEMIEDCMNAVHLSTYFSVLNKIMGQKLFLSRANVDVYHKWRFNPVYEDEGFQLDISQVVDFIIKLLPLFLRSCDNLELAVDHPMQTIFTNLFKPAVTQMMDKGQAVAAMRTLYLFYHLQINFFQDKSTQEAFKLICNDLKTVGLNIVQRIIDKRKLDLELSIGLLTLFPEEQNEILKVLQKWSAKDLRCLLSFGEVSSECCRVLGRNSESLEYSKIYQRALLLFRHNIRSAEADIVLNSSNSDYNWKVVKNIVLSSKTSIPTIFDCCSAFDLETDHVLIAFLNYLLLEAEKICLPSVDIPEEDLQLLLRNAKCAIDTISTQELVVKNLENLLKKISTYSYEILLFIHEQLLNESASFLTISSGQFEKTIELLNFLRVYQRVSPPGEVELECWISSHPIDMKFPLIANKRLPFWMFYEDKMFKIINPELTANTLKVWLEIAPLLKIPKDDLVMIAVKNSVMDYIKKMPAESFIVNPDNSFLQSIHGMLKNISDHQALVASATWVANRMPAGGNKVCSCLMAMKFAQDWHLMCPQERTPAEIFKKSTSLYHRSAIESVLYENNLASDVTLSLAQHPNQLIEQFAEDFLSAESSFKVCKAAFEMAKVVEINLEEIFCKFFFKWISVTQNVSNSLDESFALNDSTDNAELDDVNGKNILRAINLILGASMVNVNICTVMKKNFNKMTFTQRSRYLFCFVAVHGIDLAAETLKMEKEFLKLSLPTILYSSELESLHMLYSKDMVSQSNIVELVQNVLCNRSNNSKAVLCCVRMCLEHNIWWAELWDVIIQRLVAMSLVDSLEDIMLTAQGHLTHMWHYKSFISAWNAIISNSFKTDIEDLSRIIENVRKTILRCPCAIALDIDSLWNDFRYFIKSASVSLENVEPVTDICTFIKVLKHLQESC